MKTVWKQSSKVLETKVGLSSGESSVIRLHPRKLEIITAKQKYSIAEKNTRSFVGTKAGFQRLNDSALQQMLYSTPNPHPFAYDLTNLGNLIHHYLLQHHYTVQLNGKKVQYRLHFID